MRTSSIVFIALLPLVAVTAANGSVVTIGNSPLGRYLTDVSGGRLADGSLALVGYFADEAALDTALPAQDLALLAGWELFGETGTISIFNDGGKLGGDVVNETSTAGWFEGKTIYLWVFDGPTIFESTQYGIFSAQVGNSAWIFGPAGDGSQTLISLDDLNLIALVGSVDGNRLSLTGVVPEPATYAVLLGAAVFGVVALRRRKRAR